MSISLTRLDLMRIFCDVDDFYQSFEACCNQHPQLPYDGEAKRYQSRLSLSIESVNDQLKNICQIEHSRHRSGFNFLANLLGGLIAYSYHPTKPSLDLTPKDLEALSPAIF